jgi:hypothetical protein
MKRGDYIIVSHFKTYMLAVGRVNFIFYYRQ